MSNAIRDEAAPADWRRNLVVCVFGSFTTVLAMTVIVPFLPFYVEELGVHGHAAIVEWSGIVFGASFLASGLAAPLWGRFADRYGRRLILIRAALGMAVCISLTGCAQTIWQLLAIRLLTGLLGGYASGATILIATATPKARLGWALGVLSSGVMAGGLIGPFVGGVLPGWIGIRATFFAIGAMIFIAFVATVIWVEDTRAVARLPLTGSPWAHVPDCRLVVTLLAIDALATLAIFGIEPIVTVYLQTLAPSAIAITLVAGAAVSATALGSALAAPWVGRETDRIGPRHVVVVGMCATGTVLLAQGIVTTSWQLIGLRFLMGMTVAGILPAIAQALRHAVPFEIAGAILAYHTSALAIGQVAGPLIAGFIATALGLPWVFGITAMATFIGAALTTGLPRVAQSPD